MPLTCEAQVLLRELVVREDGIPEVELQKALATDLAMLGLAFVVVRDGDARWFPSSEGREAAKLETCERCGRTGYVGERRNRDGTSPLKCRVCKGLGVAHASVKSELEEKAAAPVARPETAPSVKAELEEKAATLATTDGAAGFRALAKAIKQVKTLAEQVQVLLAQAANDARTYAELKADRDAMQARLEADTVCPRISLEQVKALEASVAHLEGQVADLQHENAALRAELDTARDLYDQLAVPEEL